MKISNLPLFVRLTLTLIGCLTAFIFPIILYQISGFKHSLSTYVTDVNAVNTFNYALIIISFTLLVRKIYTIPSLLILLVVYFDVPSYPILHNIIAAILFFMLSLVMFLDKRHSYSVLMFLNIINLLIFNLYIFELIAILISTLYNLDVTYRVSKKEKIFAWN